MRQQIDTFSTAPEIFTQLQENGLLLATGEEGNLMTIGWGTLGMIWGRPVFLVMVRPSRYSFTLLEKAGEFTVNVPHSGLEEELAACGGTTGALTNKADEFGLTMEKSRKVLVPYVRECPVHLECRIIHKNDVVNGDLDSRIVSRTYVDGDYHRIYYGQVLGAYRADARPEGNGSAGGAATVEESVEQETIS